MSSGGIFQLIANDGKADKLIFATELLNKRLADIKAAKESAGLEDTSPTLPEIEKTHMLFVNAHFKPFVMVSFEYNRITPTSGNLSVTNESGSTSRVQFVIPQFGDFFSDMVLQVRLGEISDNTTYKLQAHPAVTWTVKKADGTTMFSVKENTLTDETVAPALSDDLKKAIALTDVVARANLSASVQGPTGYLTRLPWNAATFDTAITTQRTTLAAVDGTDTVEQIAAANTMTLNSNGMALDTAGATLEVDYSLEYVDNDGTQVPVSSDLSAQHGRWLRYCDFPGHRLLNNTEFFVNNNPLDSYDSEAYNYYEKLFLKVNKKVGYYKLVGQEWPHPAYSYVNQAGVREKTWVCDGLQTPKPVQPATQLWIPLLFWFCRDFRLSIPSIAIPYGQRKIEFKISSIKDVVYSVSANVFKLKKHLTFTQGEALPRISSQKELVSETDYVGTPNLNVSEFDLELYVNNLFVNNEIHAIFVKRVGFNLIRVYRQQEFMITDKTKDLHLTELKWPIEYILAGARPEANLTNPDTWHAFSHMEPITVKYHSNTSYKDGPIDSKWKYYKPVLLFDKAGITAHGVKIFDEDYNQRFYNHYLPYRYGSELNSPEDSGILFLNFCLYPGDYQPSGHINVSRAREFFFKYSSSVLGNPMYAHVKNIKLHITASALNFLLISDGSAILRYST